MEWGRWRKGARVLFCSQRATRAMTSNYCTVSITHGGEKLSSKGDELHMIIDWILLYSTDDARTILGSCFAPSARPRACNSLVASLSLLLLLWAFILVTKIDFVYKPGRYRTTRHQSQTDTERCSGRLSIALLYDMFQMGIQPPEVR